MIHKKGSIFDGIMKQTSDNHSYEHRMTYRFQYQMNNSIFSLLGANLICMYVSKG